MSITSVFLDGNYAEGLHHHLSKPQVIKEGHTHYTWVSEKELVSLWELNQHGSDKILPANYWHVESNIIVLSITWYGTMKGKILLQDPGEVPKERTTFEIKWVKALSWGLKVGLRSCSENEISVNLMQALSLMSVGPSMFGYGFYAKIMNAGEEMRKAKEELAEAEAEINDLLQSDEASAIQNKILVSGLLRIIEEIRASKRVGNSKLGAEIRESLEKLLAEAKENFDDAMLVQPAETVADPNAFRKNEDRMMQVLTDRARKSGCLTEPLRCETATLSAEEEEHANFLRRNPIVPTLDMA